MNEPLSTRKGFTLSQAAAHFAISEKTLRKRIAAGSVRAEKVALEGGGIAWRVFLDECAGSEMETVTVSAPEHLPIAPEVAPEPCPTEPEAERKRAGSQNDRAGSEMEVFEGGTEAEWNIAPEVTGTRAGSETVSAPEVAPEADTRVLSAEIEAKLLRDALEVSRANEAFLRGLVEQHQRSEAELRAALREALKAMPKAIEGDQRTIKGEQLEQTQTAIPATPRAENAALSTQVPSAQKTPPRATKREPRPLWKLILGIR